MIPLCFSIYDLANNLDLLLQIIIIGAMFFLGTLFFAYDLLHRHGSLGKLYCLLTILGGGFGYINALGWAFSTKIGKGYPLWLMLLTSLSAWGVGLYLHLLVYNIEKKKIDKRYHSKKISEKINEAIVEEDRKFSDVNFPKTIKMDEKLSELLDSEDFDGALEYLDNNIKIAKELHDDSKIGFYEKCRQTIAHKKKYLEKTSEFFKESSAFFNRGIIDDNNPIEDDDENAQ